MSKTTPAMRTLSILALLTMVITSAFAADAPASPGVQPTGLPAVDHQVYLSELPASADLMKDAAANGLTVKRLDRTSDRVVITYGYPDGHTATIGYALLSSVGSADRVMTNPAQDKRVVVAAEPEIIYYEPRYRTRYVYRDPVDNFWLPLTVGFGLGWATSYPRYFYGGYYGHGHGYSHGHGGSHRGGGGRRH